MSDIQNYNDGQELVFDDLDSSQTRTHRFMLDKIIHEMIQRKTAGFFSDGFNAVFQNATQVTLKAGLGFIDEDTGSKEPVKKPIYLAADLNVTLNTPDSGDPRIDIIAVKWKVEGSDSELRKFKNASTLVITNENLVVSKKYTSEISYISGVPAGSPAVPATPAGYIKVCEMLVSASTGLASQVAITDTRIALPFCTSGNATGSNEYDKIVGDISQIGVTHADLKAALDNASDGDKILVLSSEATDNIPVVNNNNIEIVFKRGITISKSTALVGLQIDGDDCKLVNARFSGFSVGGDKGILVNGARTYIDAPRFLSCDTNIDDQGTETFITVSYSE